MHHRHFAGIDVLRFLAASMVGIFHFAFWSWAPTYSLAAVVSGRAYKYPEVASAASIGWVGVEIFFVISGFVITFSAGRSAWAFLRSRILRLMPGAWVCATLSALILLILSIHAPGELLKLYAKSMVLWPISPWVDGVYWTLGIEMAFYGLVFALILIRARRWLVPVLCIMGLVSTAYWIFKFTDRAMLGGVTFGPTYIESRYLQLSLVPHGCFFAIGGLIWVVLCDGRSRWLWSVITLSMVGGILEIYDVGLSRAVLAGHWWLVLVAMVIWVASVALVIFSVMYATALQERIPISIARPMGLATYPLYLTHQVFGACLMRVLGNFGADRWVALAVAFTASVALSIAVATLPEPAIKTRLAAFLDTLSRRLAARRRLTGPIPTVSEAAAVTPSSERPNA